MKIVNNAVVKSCGECLECDLAYGTTGNINTSEYKNIIHPDCPLADVEVYTPDEKGNIKMIGVDGKYYNYNTIGIEKIIIIRKNHA